MTMRADYHVHLHHSPCTSDEMTAAAILEMAEKCVLEEIGLINHLHPTTDVNIFRLARQEADAYHGRKPAKVLIGAEVDLLDQEGRTSVREEIRDFVDFVTLAPGHHQLDWVTADFTVEPEEFLEREVCSIVAALGRYRFDILVHPFIYVAFPKLAPHYVGALRPGGLAPALVDDLAAALIAGNTAFEFHCRDLIIRPEWLGGESFVASYMVMMGALRARGVRFVVGSDAHRLNQIPRSDAAPTWARNTLCTINGD